MKIAGLLVVLLFVSMGCGGSSALQVEPRVIEVPVPVILVDSVFVKSPPPTEEIVALRKSLDSALTAIQERPFKPTPLVPTKPNLRQYEGQHVTVQGDTILAKFFLEYPIPYFSFAVRMAPVKAAYLDSTRVTTINEYSFWEKLGFGIFFFVVGVVVGAAGMFLVQLKGNLLK